VDEINSITKACLVRCDLDGEDCGEVIVRGALEGLGVERIDVLVNNAAAGEGGWARWWVGRWGTCVSIWRGCLMLM
jgi:NAD(P)-dependent dehydrogenase (short-subunit alcohol dehydrogenase family)